LNFRSTIDLRVPFQAGGVLEEADTRIEQHDFREGQAGLGFIRRAGGNRQQEQGGNGQGRQRAGSRV
jgi:hypothetical protein